MSEQKLFTATLRGQKDVLVAKCGDCPDHYDIVDSTLAYSSRPVSGKVFTDLRPVKVVDVDAVVIEGVTAESMKSTIELLMDSISDKSLQSTAAIRYGRKLLSQLSTPAESDEEQLICPTHKVKDCSCPEWGKFIDTEIAKGKIKLVWKPPTPPETVEIKDLSAEDLAWWLRNMQPIIPSYDSKKIARWYEIQNKFHEYGAQMDEQPPAEPATGGEMKSPTHETTEISSTSLGEDENAHLLTCWRGGVKNCKCHPAPTSPKGVWIELSEYDRINVETAMKSILLPTPLDEIIAKIYNAIKLTPTQSESEKFFAHLNNNEVRFVASPHSMAQGQSIIPEYFQVVIAPREANK